MVVVLVLVDGWDGGEGWAEIPMYQPWASRILAMKIRSSMAVPAHLYVTKGVALSRYVWYACFSRCRHVSIRPVCVSSPAQGKHTLVIRDVWALKAAGNALSGGWESMIVM